MRAALSAESHCNLKVPKVQPPQITFNCSPEAVFMFDAGKITGLEFLLILELFTCRCEMYENILTAKYPAANAVIDVCNDGNDNLKAQKHACNST